MKRPEKETAVEVGLTAARRLYWWLALVLTVVYACSGLRIIAPGEVALIRRFGKWTGTRNKVDVHLPGLLFAWPLPIDYVTRLSVKQEFRLDLEPVRREPADEPEGPPQQVAFCVTGDQNAVEIKAFVKYRIVQPAHYAMSFQDPAQVIQQIANAALTSTVNSWTMDEILQLQRLAYRWDDQAVGRLQAEFGDRFSPELWQSPSEQTRSAAELVVLLRRYAREPVVEDEISSILSAVQFTQSLTEKVLDKARHRLSGLSTGVELTAVELRSVNPPQEVQEAFLAVQSVRVDQDSWRVKASGERAEAIMAAQALASQFRAEASGRLSSRNAQASEEAVLFEAALNAYEGPAPEETAARLRREAWEQILAGAGRVLVVPRHSGSGQIRLSVPESETRR